MKLTRVERWILSNQMRILEILDPESSEHYATTNKALQSGYEIAYEWLTESLASDKHIVSEAECREVLDILGMFRALHYSDAAAKVEERDAWTVRFDGFDLNTDRQWGFCSFLIEDQDKFPELSDDGKNRNSHNSTSLERYRRQLMVYREVGSPHELSSEQIQRIAIAALHPERREAYLNEQDGVKTPPDVQ